MIRRVTPSLLAALAVAAVAPVVLAAAAAGAPERTEVVGPVIVPDSTGLYHWRYPNGLRVATRHVAGTGAVAITLAFPVGSDHDPEGRLGLADLVGEVLLTAPAGDVPARTREAMATIRPLGWSLKVNPLTTQLSEIATLEQLPGVVHELATRLRALEVDDAVVRAARATVKRELGERYVRTPESALHWQVRAAAMGDDDRALVARAAGADLDAVGAREVVERLSERYAPAGAVLAIAGDLSTLDLDALLDGVFATLPAGAPPPPQGPRPLAPVERTRVRADVTRPGGVVGVLAPSLGDSLHPSFFMATLALAMQANRAWGAPEPPAPSRFHYSLLDDPTLVRLYPRMPADSTAPSALAAELGWLARETHRLSPSVTDFEPVRRGLLWLIGGPATAELKAAMRRDPAALNAFCNAIATRELWGGEPFWSEYRRRFDLRVSPGYGTWAGWFADRDRHAVLVFAPRP